MFFYIDESGQTGQNLFDEAQPFLYYGVLSSKVNLDVLAEPHINKVRKKLGVHRLHAAELGNGKLIQIVDDIDFLKKKYNIVFDIYRIAKADHALISFFDQVFDQGLNPAVPWTAYWTPLRYILLIKITYLFDEELLKMAWEARILRNNKKAEKILQDVCKILLERVYILPDIRSKTIITDALRWAIKNPSEIGYNVTSNKDALQISPNLIGFQTVMHGIAERLKKNGKKASKIIVDQQSQFNSAQKFITEIYQKGRDISWLSGPGLPIMDLKHIPDVPIECISGTKSTGLEIVDIFIWIFKRHMENKELAPELYSIIKGQLYRGNYNEISINGLMERWGKWFDELPEPTKEQEKEARKIMEEQERRRQEHVV